MCYMCSGVFCPQFKHQDTVVALEQKPTAEEIAGDY